MVNVPLKLSRANRSADSDPQSHYRIGLWGAMLWFLRCIFNNLIPVRSHRLGHIEVRTFRPKSIEVSLENAQNSPGRLLLDRFLEEFPWTKAVEQLGPLSIVDFGCGSGQYTAKLPKLVGDELQVAHGLDICEHPDWDQHSETRVRFGLVEKSQLDLPDHNFAISVTSLEHVEFDAGVVEVLLQHSKEGSKASMQVHLVPAPRSIWLYLTHGYRQYTIATIAKLFASASKTARITVFGLGGSATARVHKHWIRNGVVWPGGQRRVSDPNGYALALSAALQAERTSRKAGGPILYAVVVEMPIPERGIFE